MRHIHLFFILLIGVALTLLHSCQAHDTSRPQPAYQLYTYAVKSLHAGQQSEAELSLKKFINLYQSPQANTYADSIQQMFPQGLVQLLNTYQSEGKVESCVTYFDSLCAFVDAPQNQHLLIAQHYKRDVHVVLAYAVSRTEQTEQAAQLMDKALALKLYNATPERKFRDYAYAAAVYFCEPAYQQKVEVYGQKALAEAEHCENKAGVGWLTSMMGSWYARMGRVHDAVDMYNKGFRFSQQMNDTLGMANARIYQANCMLQWNMPSEAQKYASTVVDMVSHSLNFNPQIAAQAYIIMARSLVDTQHNREAMRYINMANRLCMSLPYNSGNSDLDVLTGAMGVRNEPPQSADYVQAEAKLKRAAHAATPMLKARAWYELARTHLATKRNAEAETDLDSLYNALQVMPKSIFSSNAYDMALKHYIETKNTPKIVQIATAVNQMRTDSTFKRVTQSIAQVMVDINNERQQQNFDEVLRKQQRSANIGHAVFAALFIFLIIAWYRMRRRYVSLKKTSKSVQLQLAEAKQRLTHESSARGVLERKLRSVEQSNVESIKDGVHLLDILQRKGEVKFREYFDRAYPYFMRNLRQRVPDITRKEELFCIVMALGCDNNEMMEMFNIARSSVHMAKYRLRKKMKLAEGESIEEQLTAWLNERN